MRGTRLIVVASLCPIAAATSCSNRSPAVIPVDLETRASALLAPIQNDFEDGTIGVDIGVGAKLRPFVNENLFVVLGFSLLKPGGGLASALGSNQPLHSFVGAIQLAY